VEAVAGVVGGEVVRGAEMNLSQIANSVVVLPAVEPADGGWGGLAIPGQSVLEPEAGQGRFRLPRPRPAGRGAPGRLNRGGHSSPEGRIRPRLRVEDDAAFGPLPRVAREAVSVEERRGVLGE